MAQALQSSRSFTALPTYLVPSFAALQLRTFATSTSLSAKHPKATKRKHRDLYAQAQVAQRKAANVARQEILKAQNLANLGDPIKGITTPFVQSFDTAQPVSAPPSESSDDSSPQADQTGIAPLPITPTTSTADTTLNHFLTPAEVSNALQYSHTLTAPVPSFDRGASSPATEAKLAASHAYEHANASTALSRILGSHVTSARARKHMNIQRCITTFGRHNTDAVLQRRAPSEIADPDSPRFTGKVGEESDVMIGKTPRAGPDTGSSEVQIAILTMKIRALNKHMEDPRNRAPDKMGRTHLRNLVHRRQKLMAYMKRKERGGPRWTNLVESLGLTRGMYEGEITV